MLESSPNWKQQNAPLPLSKGMPLPRYRSPTQKPLGQRPAKSPFRSPAWKKERVLDDSSAVLCFFSFLAGRAGKNGSWTTLLWCFVFFHFWLGGLEKTGPGRLFCGALFFFIFGWAGWKKRVLDDSSVVFCCVYFGSGRGEGVRGIGGLLPGC